MPYQHVDTIGVYEIRVDESRRTDDPLRVCLYGPGIRPDQGIGWPRRTVEEARQLARNLNHVYEAGRQSLIAHPEPTPHHAGTNPEEKSR